MNRLGIFCMYDSEGVVDDCVIYLLREIKKVLSHLTIICNGDLTPEGRALLEKITDDIFFRENTGFDFGAWRAGILRKKNNLGEYDELVLLNDSFYGPFYPFAEIFDKMDENPETDFWGMTIHGQAEDPTKICPYGYIPEHLQSYFLVIRAKLLHSADFLDYWSENKVAEDFDHAVLQHEVCFTKYFFDKGFDYAAYCDTRDWERGYDVSVNHYLLSIEKLLTVYRCPILKKKALRLPRSYYIVESCGDGPHRGLEFIKNNTNYDLSLIWKNLLRTQNISAIKSNLGLDYILPEGVKLGRDNFDFSEIIIVAHLYYEDLMPECADYLCRAPRGIYILVTVDSEHKKSRVEEIFRARARQCEVRLVAGRGRDLSALLVSCTDVFSKFKYLCFVHDKKSQRAGRSIAVGESFFHMLWNNVLASEIFVKNVIETFESEPNLGLLVPPPPHHGEYRYFIYGYWTSSCYDQAVQLAADLQIPAKFLSTDFSPLAIGSVFWCRTRALEKLTAFAWKVEHFPKEPMPDDGTVSHALERIFPFAAQTAGFYTGWLMTPSFARDELENFIYFSVNQQYIAPAPQVCTLTDLVKANVPQRYWFLLRPVKKLLEKLGFRP